MNKDDIEIGMLVNYHSIIGGPITKEQCVIRSKPWQLGCGECVVLINGMSGGVSLNALTVVPLIVHNCGACLHHDDKLGCYHNKKIIKGKCECFC
jgi:hypothetical protein